MKSTLRRRVRFLAAHTAGALRLCAFLAVFVGLLGMHSLAGSETSMHQASMHPALVPALIPVSVPASAPAVPWAGAFSEAPAVHAEATVAGPSHQGRSDGAACASDCTVEHTMGAACALAFPLLLLALRRPGTFSSIESSFADLSRFWPRPGRYRPARPSLVELSISRT